MVVTQPYGFNRELFEKYCAGLQITFRDATEWANYFPGEACMVLLELGPEAQKRLLREFRHGR